MRNARPNALPPRPMVASGCARVQAKSHGRAVTRHAARRHAACSARRPRPSFGLFASASRVGLASTFDVFQAPSPREAAARRLQAAHAKCARRTTRLSRRDGPIQALRALIHVQIAAGEVRNQASKSWRRAEGSSARRLARWKPARTICTAELWLATQLADRRQAAQLLWSSLRMKLASDTTNELKAGVSGNTCPN